MHFVNLFFPRQLGSISSSYSGTFFGLDPPHIITTTKLHGKLPAAPKVKEDLVSEKLWIGIMLPWLSISGLFVLSRIPYGLSGVIRKSLKSMTLDHESPLFLFLDMEEIAESRA